MWSDPIENTLFAMREALAAIQRGHEVYFGELDKMLEKAISVRQEERSTGELTRP